MYVCNSDHKVQYQTVTATLWSILVYTILAITPDSSYYSAEQIPQKTESGLVCRTDCHSETGQQGTRLAQCS